MQNLSPETREIAIEGLQISKFSRGRMPPDPPQKGLRLRRSIYALPKIIVWLRHCIHGSQKYPFPPGSLISLSDSE